MKQNYTIVNILIRKQLISELATKAAISYTENLSYADCKAIAKELDCDTNTIARLAAIPNFKATQSLKPDLEQKIATFLGYKNYADLEVHLMLHIVFDMLKKLTA